MSSFGFADRHGQTIESVLGGPGWFEAPHGAAGKRVPRIPGEHHRVAAGDQWAEVQPGRIDKAPLVVLKVGGELPDERCAHDIGRSGLKPSALVVAEGGAPGRCCVLERLLEPPNEFRQ